MEDSHYIKQAEVLINSVKETPLTVEERREKAVELAAIMMQEARRTRTFTEQTREEQLAKMMDDPVGKHFVFEMTDRCFRSRSKFKVAGQLQQVLKKNGVPSFLPFRRRVELSLFKRLKRKWASLLVGFARKALRKETQGVIVPGERMKLRAHLKKRHKEGVELNINFIGETVLGEEEAKKRLEMYIEALSRSDVTYVSVKISTICSQLSLIARSRTLDVLAERLKRLYRVAAEKGKFINLDMEEYRDLHLTVALFKRVLDEPEFANFSAGIVLQAYLPDASIMQQELTMWAVKRVAGGGAPIKIRLVKGANLAMEAVEASTQGWARAPYENKVDTDANFKRMLVYGAQIDHAHAVHLGIGSHNLFDIAYAMLLRAENGLEEEISFEMLEGMAEPLRRIVQKITGRITIYCPVAKDNEFQHAIAYLVRRLDENTAPDNFLRYVFKLIPGTRAWQKQASRFSLACHAASSVSLRPRRTQNRYSEIEKKALNLPFANEPDTDWSLPINCKWVLEKLSTWKEKVHPPIPLIIDGKEVFPGAGLCKVLDPSAKEMLSEAATADHTLINAACAAAKKGFNTWYERLPSEREEVLGDVSHFYRESRGELLCSMVANAGKSIEEADSEISEAIDMIDYYRQQMHSWMQVEDIDWEPKGVVVVASPWNFPCAIPTGGIAAALAAGNSVIFKPAPEAIHTGFEIAKLFWKAGVSPQELQFVVCNDDVGSELIKRADKVILTGSTETARSFLKMRPDIDLSAETGGKNSMIVTAMADRDLAIADIIHSAFSHSGQKCSACSLLILEKEVYDDKNFLRQLRDAAESLPVGSAWDPYHRITSLITPPNERLLHPLEKGESWLLEPKVNGQIMTPGIKLGVLPGSFSHQTEMFGPLLSVMRADSLDQALEFANGTPYGLTAGLHTLDDNEKKVWKAKICVGNGYINRSTVGAIVRRQPFGGCKASQFGLSVKAGGPNTLLAYMTANQVGLPKNVAEARFEDSDDPLLKASYGSYAHAWNTYFSEKHDPSKILGQDNVLEYRPAENLFLRLQEGDSENDRQRVEVACKIVGANITVSNESEETFLEHLPEYARVRFLSKPSESLLQRLAEKGCTSIWTPVLANGRIELIHYLREVNFSIDTHRYGNLL